MAKTTKDKKDSKAKTKKEPEPKERNIATTHETRKLRCQLTPDEIRVATQKLVETLDKAREVEADKKAVATEYKARLDRLDAEVNELVGTVRDGHETREVHCELRLDYDEMTSTCVRMDTDEVVSERPMQEDEKQMTMPFDEDDKTPGDATAMRNDLISKYGLGVVDIAEDTLVKDNSLYRRLSRSAATAESGWKCVQMLAEYLRDENAAGEPE